MLYHVFMFLGSIFEVKCTEMFPKGEETMVVQYNEIQELLRSRADLYARLNLDIYLCGCIYRRIV